MKKKERKKVFTLPKVKFQDHARLTVKIKSKKEKVKALALLARSVN